MASPILDPDLTAYLAARIPVLTSNVNSEAAESGNRYMFPLREILADIAFNLPLPAYVSGLLSAVQSPDCFKHDYVLKNFGHQLNGDSTSTPGVEADLVTYLTARIADLILDPDFTSAPDDASAYSFVMRFLLADLVINMPGADRQGFLNAIVKREEWKRDFKLKFFYDILKLTAGNPVVQFFRLGDANGAGYQAGFDYTQGLGTGAGNRASFGSNLQTPETEGSDVAGVLPSWIGRVFRGLTNGTSLLVSAAPINDGYPGSVLDTNSSTFGIFADPGLVPEIIEDFGFPALFFLESE